MQDLRTGKVFVQYFLLLSKHTHKNYSIIFISFTNFLLFPSYTNSVLWELNFANILDLILLERLRPMISGREEILPEPKLRGDKVIFSMSKWGQKNFDRREIPLPDIIFDVITFAFLKKKNKKNKAKWFCTPVKISFSFVLKWFICQHCASWWELSKNIFIPEWDSKFSNSPLLWSIQENAYIFFKN